MKSSTQYVPDRQALPARKYWAFPFAALAGMRPFKRALLMAAVEPRLKGVLLAGPPGSGKTTLARGFINLVIQSGNDSVPRVELPLNATEDRLVGGIDIERTLETGRRQACRGLLAEADGGVLYADQINLLDPFASSLIAAALDRGRVKVEREGLSEDQPARFILVGTYDPAEGEVDTTIRDRIGILLHLPDNESAEFAAQVATRRMEFDRDPAGFIKSYESETGALKAALVEARAFLPRVEISSRRVRRLAEAARSLGVTGNRADIFAVYAARAIAALERRRSVNEEDLIEAIRLVLVPRANRLPDRSLAESRTTQDAGALLEPEAAAIPNGRTGQDAGATDDDEPRAAETGVEDLILKAIDSEIEIGPVNRPTKDAGRGSRRRSQSGDSTKGGRHYRSTSRKIEPRRIAVGSTINAAVSRQPHANRRAGADRPRIDVRPEDLRYKRLKRRAGTLFVFLVDASGSMAVNRLAQAKGAMLRILERAYLHRDKVAMISFRRAAANVLLAPTRSVELARRLVETLPAGGATPLAAGLIKTLEIARQSRLAGARNVALILFTDGRANVAWSGGDIEQELRALGAMLESNRIALTLVDTRPRFASSGQARELAGLLAARYLYLPRNDATTLAREILVESKDSA